MPYFIYKITSGPTNLVKTLEKLEAHDTFKEAKKKARAMRADLSESDKHEIKVMFANSELEAEESLMEKRQAPILREWKSSALRMVDENEYRSTYRSVNRRRCVFEKAVLTRRCDCLCSTRFYLADREGISCNSADIHPHCDQFLKLLRQNAKFTLKLTAPEAELPHAKEIKVQNGGLLGIQRVLRPDLGATHVADISGLITLGEKTFGSLQSFPYREIVKSIANFEGRRRQPSKH